MEVVTVLDRSHTITNVASVTMHTETNLQKQRAMHTATMRPFAFFSEVLRCDLVQQQLLPPGEYRALAINRTDDPRRRRERAMFTRKNINGSFMAAARQHVADSIFLRRRRGPLGPT